MPEDATKIVGYGALAAFLTEQGYPLSKSTVSKICSPAINTGPPAEGLWGRLPKFSPDRVLDWARARMRPVDEARSHPVMATGPAFVPSTTQKSRVQAPAPEVTGISRTANKPTGKAGRRHGEVSTGA
jgi:hypothetical protein